MLFEQRDQTLSLLEKVVLPHELIRMAARLVMLHHLPRLLHLQFFLLPLMIGASFL